jgi:hypothetical protein
MSDFSVGLIPVLGGIEDNVHSAVGWSPPMEEGTANEYNAEIHVSEAKEWRQAIDAEQERLPLRQTRRLKI